MEFTAVLRGLSFRQIDDKAFFNTLSERDGLLIEREPHNQFDPNAIKVMSPDGVYHIGYVAKEVAVELAPLMDEGRFFTCTVDSLMMKQCILLIKETELQSDAIIENTEASE